MTKALAPQIEQTALEVWTLGGVLAGTFEFSGARGLKMVVGDLNRGSRSAGL